MSHLQVFFVRRTDYFSPFKFTLYFLLAQFITIARSQHIVLNPHILISVARCVGCELAALLKL